jgi:hypothetical protein
MNRGNSPSITGLVMVGLLQGACVAATSEEREGADGVALGALTDGIKKGPVEEVASKPELLPTKPVKPKPSNPKPAGEPYADLRLEGTLRFTEDLVVEVDVINAGTIATPSVYGSLSVGGNALSGSLYPHGSFVPLPLQPGQRGYIRAWPYPKGALQECTRYRVKIDTGREMQQASPLSPFVYDNDSGIVRSPCLLTWFAPINEATLYGVYPASVVGDGCTGPFCSAGPLDPVLSDGTESTPPTLAAEIKGKSIADIVGSFTSGRADTQLCSGCHYTGSNRTGLGMYLPPVKSNSAKEIGKDQLISFFVDYGSIESKGKLAWSSRDGWAERFVNIQKSGVFYKPEPLRQVFKKWMADGRR